MKRHINTFVRLAAYLIGFGLLVGMILPFCMLLFGVRREIALSGWFIVTCVGSGAIVGFVNIEITRGLVKKKLRTVTSKMEEATSTILAASHDERIGTYDPAHCLIPVDTPDEFGSCARAFNELVSAFAGTLQTLDEIKTYTSMFTCQLDLQTLIEYALDLLVNGTNADAGAILADRDGEIQLLQCKGIQDACGLTKTPDVLKTFARGERFQTCYTCKAKQQGTLSQDARYRPL